MAKKQISSPSLRKLKHPIETMDSLDKYDPASTDEKEVAAFERELARLMSSNATIVLDPRMDPRDLPKARNYHEWLTGDRFLKYRPFARQIDIGAQLNLDVCWKCSPKFYTHDIDFKLEPAAFARRYQFMSGGVCPSCKSTRLEGLKKGVIADKIKHIGIAGQRCVVGDTFVLCRGKIARIANVVPPGSGEIPNTENNIFIRSPNGYDRPESFFRFKTRETTRITLDNGMVIEGTNNHPLFTNRGFERMDKLTTDDHVPVVMVQTAFGEAENLNIDADVQEALATNRVPDSVLESNKKSMVSFLHALMFQNDKWRKTVELGLAGESLWRECLFLIHAVGGRASLKKSDECFTLDMDDLDFLSEKSLRRTFHDYYWSRIRSITKVDHPWPIEVYDFSIPTARCFIANMVINHNSSKCMPGDSIVYTEDGPVELIDLIRRNLKVRLPLADAPSKLVSSHRDFVYTFMTDHDIPVRMNGMHRMFTLEHGYVHATYQSKGVKHLKVGMHFEIPKFPKLIKEIRQSEWNRGKAGYYVNKLNVVSESYSYRRGFFDELMTNSLRYGEMSVTFVVANRTLYRHLRHWLEMHGVACFPVKSSEFGVDMKAFLKEFSILASEHRKHYWQTLSSMNRRLPPAFGDLLGPLLKCVLDNTSRFPWWKNDAAQKKLMEIYNVWSLCQRRRELTTARLRHLFTVLWPWRNLAWTAKEKEDFGRLIGLMRYGVKTRFAKIVKIKTSNARETVYDIEVPKYNWFIAEGYNSHNSVSFGHLVSYTTHRLLMTGDPASIYGLLPGQYLTAILTATSVDQATRNLYRPMRSILETSNWFKTFNQWAKDRQEILGVELVRIRETFAIYRFGSLDVRVIAPNRATLRGYTAYASGVDELGHFDTDDAKLKGSGIEIYGAVTNACGTVNGMARRLRDDGDNDVVFAVSHAISSPFAKSDPIVRLHGQNVDEDSALTYIIPTWRFNPFLPFEECRKIAIPDTFMRDFGCVLQDASGNFISKITHVTSLMDERRNAARIRRVVYESPRSRQKFSVGRVASSFQASAAMQCGMTLDMGYNNNSFAVTIFRLEMLNEDLPPETLADSLDSPVQDVNDDDIDADFYDDDYVDEPDEAVSNCRVVIEAMGEVQPSESEPIHYTQLMETVIIPLIERFNVKVVISDRWQTLRIQQDICDSHGVNWVNYQLKKPHFLKFRMAVTDQAISLPDAEIDDDDIMQLANPRDFENYPIAHFVKQCLTVKETPKTVEKGADFSDDLFRTVVLAHAISEEVEFRGFLSSDNSPVERGEPSMVITASAKVTETSTHVMQSFSGKGALIQAGTPTVTALATHRK